jgi:hypothetical protein
MSLPRGEAVGELCSRMPDPSLFDYYFARIGANGLSVFYNQFEPMNLDSIFLELGIPSSKSIFETYLGQYGYKIKTTSGENTFQRFLELIGSISEIRLIRNEMAFKLFLKMTPLRGKKIAKEIASELKDNSLIDRLDEIISKRLNSAVISAPVIKTIDDICSSLGLQSSDKPQLFEILGILNRQKILLRGKYFDCSSCQTHLWYQLDQIEREIKCYACNAITTIPVSVGSKELVDSYKLNELVMVAMDQGVVPVLYVLSYLHEILVGGYHYLAEFEFFEAGNSVADGEIDLILNCIGKVGLFEVKAQRGFDKNQFERMVKVAKKIEADFIVLATLLPKDHPELVDVKDWLKNSGFNHYLLSLEELLMGDPKKNKEFIKLLGLFS